MRFEKLNENKIRITLSHQDLIEKDVDFHTFMADSIESQDLFFDCLKEAEKQIGFVTKDYMLKIEALAMSSGDFILTVTRSLPKNNTNKKMYYKKKNISYNFTNAIYSFSSFDDYCEFITYLNKKSIIPSNIADFILLYEYNNTYYLVFKNINITYKNLKNVLYCISEFGNLTRKSNTFENKLFENGNLIIKNNALKISMKYF